MWRFLANERVTLPVLVGPPRELDHHSLEELDTIVQTPFLIRVYECRLVFLHSFTRSPASLTQSKESPCCRGENGHAGSIQHLDEHIERNSTLLRAQAP